MRNWKKLLAAITAGTLCLGCAGMSGLQNVMEMAGTVLSASAKVPDSYDGVYGDLYYEVDASDEISIVGCDTSATSVSIPSEIDGKEVTKIGVGAFYFCINLSNVTIPYGVKEIEGFAFSYCRNISTIKLPFGLSKIGDGAFQDCYSLESIDWTDDVVSIGEAVFKNCYNLNKILIPSEVTELKRDTFSGCEALSSITLTDSMQDIGESAFEGANVLTDVYYSGNASQWGAIQIQPENDVIEKANIHYHLGETFSIDFSDVTLDELQASNYKISYLAYSSTSFISFNQVCRFYGGIINGEISTPPVFAGSSVTYIDGKFNGAVSHGGSYTMDSNGNITNKIDEVPAGSVGNMKISFPDTAAVGDVYKVELELSITKMVNRNMISFDLEPIGQCITIQANNQTTQATSYTETTETSSNTESTSIETTTTVTNCLGDVTMDGKIDLADVILLNKIVMNVVDSTTAMRKCGDINQSHEIDSADPMLLLKFLVHIITEIPYQETET